jgi:predicted metal-dependent phosphoesterase TrpH
MNQLARCDLHCHSTESDGTLTPRQLVELARDLNLRSLSLTDHDTIAGVEEAKKAGEELGVRVLSGVEISVEYAGKTVHMLGYCFDAGAAKLQAELERLVRGRNERNVKIVQRLNELGLAVTLEEVEAEAGGKVVGRPHIARVLLRHGYVQTWEEAFDKYLARGAAAYFERLRFTPHDAVALIREAGGVAVLAHPKYVALHEGETLDDIVQSLVQAGLEGIECYYTEHTPEETAQYIELAKRYNLVITGGSDFHGDVKPEISLGSGTGALFIPDECADALVERARRHESKCG